MASTSHAGVAVGVGVFVTVVSVIAAVAQVLGIDGSLILGGLVVVLATVAVVGVGLVKRLRLSKGPEYIQLEDALRQELPHAEYVDCVFSAGDRLRQVFHTVLEDDRVDRIKKGLRVRVIVRTRSSDSMLRVDENLDRLASMLSRAGIGFESKAIPWEHCMVEGVVFNGDKALVGFYYREQGLTYTVSNLLLRVNKSRGDADQVLYLSLRRTFDALWSLPNGDQR